MSSIQALTAREILDSRGTPTLEVTAVLADGTVATAGVPSGASTGKHEALELRDGDRHRYNGLGVLNAVANVNGQLSEAVQGMEATNQRSIDQRFLDVDGTVNKSKMGANAIVGASLAVARAAATSAGLQLFQHLQQTFDLPTSPILPVPLANLFNGGRHASTNLDLQEIWVVPRGISSTAEQVRAATEINAKLKGILIRRNLDTDVGDEGGFSPRVQTTHQAFEMVSEAVDEAGYSLGEEVVLGVDAAASSFFHDGHYRLAVEDKSLSREELSDFYANLVQRYMIRLLEDPLEEDDWDGWQALRAHAGMVGVTIIGDDLFTTNQERLAEGIRRQAANGIIIKPNQIGTITEAIDTAKLAKANNYTVVASHRSGETNDHWIVDLAVAIGATYIKVGAPVRGERVAKYNRLLQIAQAASNRG